ncbi:hypothetical protein BV379_19590 [Rhodovulum sulfidophilum]|nr:hypothetical protein BV379_19590 [Rhodovulum sulfidophilum]
MGAAARADVVLDQHSDAADRFAAQLLMPGLLIVCGYPIWRQTRSSVLTTFSPRQATRGSAAGQEREWVSTMV